MASPKRGRPKGVPNKKSKNERNQAELQVIAKERMPAVVSMSSRYKYKSDKFTCQKCKREVSVHFDLKTDDDGKIRKLHEC